MIEVPLAAEPSQSLSVRLGGQACQIEVRTNGAFMYFSLWVNDVPIVRYRLCQNRQRLLISSKYQPFAGDFMFVDASGDDPPVFTGLGTRWFLMYLTDDE